MNLLSSHSFGLTLSHGLSEFSTKLLDLNDGCESYLFVCLLDVKAFLLGSGKDSKIRVLKLDTLVSISIFEPIFLMQG